MSDSYLTVIPTDPYWRPIEDAADRAAAVLSGLLPDDDARRGLEAKWHDSVEVVFCGANLEKISCPHCGAVRSSHQAGGGRQSQSATPKAFRRSW
ncbi:hypothetical protein [Streptomyces sp. NPDC091294]|uniref:hypothetical protein n=1 Tax=Streptomyces sp. NPDC091294 TaxID=3365992 RepID=UPI00381C0CAD